MGDAMLKANPRLRNPAKVIGKGKGLYDAVTDPYGYLRDEAIEKGAEYIWRNAPRTPPSWLAPGVAGRCRRRRHPVSLTHFAPCRREAAEERRRGAARL
jgi:hypothetical protein